MALDHYVELALVGNVRRLPDASIRQAASGFVGAVHRLLAGGVADLAIAFPGIDGATQTERFGVMRAFGAVRDIERLLDDAVMRSLIGYGVFSVRKGAVPADAVYDTAYVRSRAVEKQTMAAQMRRARRAQRKYMERMRATGERPEKTPIKSVDRPFDEATIREAVGLSMNSMQTNQSFMLFIEKVSVPVGGGAGRLDGYGLSVRGDAKGNLLPLRPVPSFPMA